MQIFINKNGQQFGPFEENKVLEMLQNRQLSPNDFGFRQGDGQWRKLTDIFPVHSINPSPPILPISISQTNKVKSNSGWRRFFGNILLRLGILILLAGVVGAGRGYYYSQPAQHYSCQMADKNLQKSEQSLKEYQAAKGTPLEVEKGLKAKKDIDDFGAYSNSCGQLVASFRLWLFVFILIGIIGFVGTVGGFVVRRVS